MGLLDSIIGGAISSGALGSLFGENGQHANLVRELMNVVNSPGIGGIGGLISHLQKGGIGDAVNSWISTGQNQPVTGQEMHAALPPELVTQLASRVGLDPQQVSGALAQVLPGIINKLTPDGSVPHASGLQDALGSLVSGFFAQKSS